MGHGEWRTPHLLLILTAIHLAAASTIKAHQPAFLSPLPRLSKEINRRRTPFRAVATEESLVGTANLDWEALRFEYLPTDGYCVYRYTAEKGWDDGRMEQEPYISLHVGATALHYGQAAFEGLKAFHCKDGKVRMFRPLDNARRLQRSAERLMMPPVPENIFIYACRQAVLANLAYVPPYGTGGSLYLRPVLIGSSPRIGVQPAEEYTFFVMVIPVGDYYKGGLQPVSAWVVEGYDRAAPQGVGAYKVAGNYAADLLPNSIGKSKGFPIALYLDAKENRYIDEFSTSNFIAVTQDGNTYVTPESPSILPSITNLSLMELAKDEGLDTQRRPVPIEEVGSFSEVAACGTAVIITPIDRIVHKDKTYVVRGPDGRPVGPVFERLYRRVRGIQYGEEADKFGWMVPLIDR
ncbi:unnamed protein product [Vitrella brassicaformis CCMP3155]|uniref:Branched-chain-amino-acid transaminase n=2 Tax=Vitrella brassicaformis TaxID=1169539 RepID=A0A0G4F3S3_VITBC|nr:unnamed protein product [Vitrella brassicaformis CCMP3155]|eukprot:CEM06352.1 unnamed protein product [Vitrella brassicaformis CCMP3155]